MKSAFDGDAAAVAVQAAAAGVEEEQLKPRVESGGPRGVETRDSVCL